MLWNNWCLILNISHGLISGVLYFIIGILYKDIHSRYIYYSGLASVMHYLVYFSFIYNIEYEFTIN